MWYAADDTADYADYASSPGEGGDSFAVLRRGGFMCAGLRLAGWPAPLWFPVVRVREDFRRWGCVLKAEMGSISPGKK